MMLWKPLELEKSLLNLSKKILYLFQRYLFSAIMTEYLIFRIRSKVFIALSKAIENIFPGESALHIQKWYFCANIWYTQESLQLHYRKIKVEESS